MDTVVEATDTIVQSLDNTFITDIPERQYLYQGSDPSNLQNERLSCLVPWFEWPAKRSLDRCLTRSLSSMGKVALAKNIPILKYDDYRFENCTVWLRTINMLNQIFQLTQPKNITIKYQEEDMSRGDKVLIRPYYMAICHADQRYYQGGNGILRCLKEITHGPDPWALVWYRGSGSYGDLSTRTDCGHGSQSASHQTGVSSLKIIWRTHFFLVDLLALCRKSLPSYRWIVWWNFPEEVRGPVTTLRSLVVLLAMPFIALTSCPPTRELGLILVTRVSLM